MNQEKIGKFIAGLRKEKGLTQQELANQLGVTDRAVSNWENGRRMPDVTFYKPICEIFCITANELINGEKIMTDHFAEISDDLIIKTLKKNKNDKRLAIKIIIVLLILTIIMFSIVFQNKYPKIDIQNLYLGHLDPGFSLKKQFSYKGISIYYYGVENVQICGKKDYCRSLKSSLENKQITLKEMKSYFEQQAVLNNYEQSTLFDGGTAIFINSGYSIMFCNTIDGNNDIYIGNDDMIEKLNGNYCGKEEYNIKYFIRTYKILEASLDKNDSDFVNVVLEDNSGKQAKVKINYTNYLIVGKTYEFTFSAYERFTDNIKNIFANAILMYVRETDNLLSEQVNEEIYFNENMLDDTELNELDHVSMKIKDGTLTSKSATLLITDFSGNKYIYGDSYRIDKKEQGKWIQVSKTCNNCAWNLIAYGPDKSNMLVFNIDWEYLYGELSTGNYRIVKDVIRNNNKVSQLEDILYISVEFSIK